ncbi:MAG: hypothetical protein H7240_00075 [Glaciimonas sp.]|nr:hypothetical protein [Glaciimonas sp.]
MTKAALEIIAELSNKKGGTEKCHSNSQPLGVAGYSPNAPNYRYATGT